MDKLMINHVAEFCRHAHPDRMPELTCRPGENKAGHAPLVKATCIIGPTKVNSDTVVTPFKADYEECSTKSSTPM